MTKKVIEPPEEFSEENNEELMKVIKCLRNMIDNEKYLKVRKDTNFILRYLRCSQYNPEIGFSKIQAYYNHKRENPEWYTIDETLESFKSELDNHLFFMLEERDRFGKRIYINKLGMIDSSKTTLQKQSQLQDFFLECILDEEETQKNGLCIVVDLKNFSWTLLKWLTPNNVATAVKKIESLPFKKIEFHVVNTSALLNAAIKLIWPFLSAKTKENIHFHYEDWPSLHKIIDPKFLPQQYGGTKQDWNIEKLLEKIPRSKQKLSENLEMGYTQNPEN